MVQAEKKNHQAFRMSMLQTALSKACRFKHLHTTQMLYSSVWYLSHIVFPWYLHLIHEIKAGGLVGAHGFQISGILPPGMTNFSLPFYVGSLMALSCLCLHRIAGNSVSVIWYFGLVCSIWLTSVISSSLHCYLN